MATKIEEYAQDLSKKFDALSALQGEALTKNLDSQHTELKQQFAEITKTDVALNNILVRARPQHEATYMFVPGVF